MYTPPFNAVTDENAVEAMVESARSAWLVTADAQRVPAATLLPILRRGDTVIAHMAKANPHWRGIDDGAPGLYIVTGPEAYVSPSWYAAKAEHGRVVPTWNYSAVHLSGALHVHHDLAWLRRAVTLLTVEHEHRRAHSWEVADAPSTYVDGQLNGIVGIEMTVAGVVGKDKVSQNRSAADRRGVVDGLRADAEQLLGGFQAAQARDIAADMDDRLAAGE